MLAKFVGRCVTPACIHRGKEGRSYAHKNDAGRCRVPTGLVNKYAEHTVELRKQYTRCVVRIPANKFGKHYTIAFASCVSFNVVFPCFGSDFNHK